MVPPDRSNAGPGMGSANYYRTGMATMPGSKTMVHLAEWCRPIQRAGLRHQIPDGPLKIQACSAIVHCYKGNPAKAKNRIRAGQSCINRSK
jgi:hypothetical protein